MTDSADAPEPTHPAAQTGAARVGAPAVGLVVGAVGLLAFGVLVAWGPKGRPYDDGTTPGLAITAYVLIGLAVVALALAALLVARPRGRRPAVVAGAVVLAVGVAGVISVPLALGLSYPAEVGDVEGGPQGGPGFVSQHRSALHVGGLVVTPAGEVLDAGDGQRLGATLGPDELGMLSPDGALLVTSGRRVLYYETPGAYDRAEPTWSVDSPVGNLPTRPLAVTDGRHPVVIIAGDCREPRCPVVGLSSRDGSGRWRVRAAVPGRYLASYLPVSPGQALVRAPTTAAVGVRGRAALLSESGVPSVLPVPFDDYDHAILGDTLWTLRESRGDGAGSCAVSGFDAEGRSLGERPFPCDRSHGWQVVGETLYSRPVRGADAEPGEQVTAISLPDAVPHQLPVKWFSRGVGGDGFVIDGEAGEYTAYSTVTGDVAWQVSVPRSEDDDGGKGTGVADVRDDTAALLTTPSTWVSNFMGGRDRAVVTVVDTESGDVVTRALVPPASDVIALRGHRALVVPAGDEETAVMVFE